MRRAFIGCLAVCLLASSAPAQVYDSPDAADADPDFALQGEFTDSTRGLQVIAEGDGQFQVKIYKDGLPGAGWDGSEVQVVEADDATVEAMVQQFQRVRRSSPTLGAKPPRGATVLFDGTQQSLDQHWKPFARMTDDGLLMEGCTSTDTFGDYSLHLEFRLPFMPKARGQARGNSGVYHQGRYETQILDSFGLEGKNNETGGIYEIRDPDLNMCLPPLTWQTYDVDFTAARFDADGNKTTDARITVRLNGVVVHREVDLPRGTRAAPVKEGPEDGPIYLQDHGNPVRFRNVWVNPRDVLAEARRPIVPGFERIHAAEPSVAGGRLLLAELNCVACHRADSVLVDFIDPKQAPILDSVGNRLHAEWMMKYIANPRRVKPGTTMPDMMVGMSDQQRRDAAIALTNFLVGEETINLGSKRGNRDNGDRLFHESGCVACHLPQNEKKANRATSVPLVGLGDKYSRGSLEAFLKDPLAVRPSGRMPHIDLGGNHWTDVAQYLTGDTSISFGNGGERPKHPNMKFSAYHGSWDKMPDFDQLQPESAGVSHGLDIGVALRDENIGIRFDGFLPIEKAGKYSFRLASDDGSLLYINGKKVIDNDGVHGVEAIEGSIRLSEGSHAIRVEFFEKGGGEELTLDWAGPGVESGRIDKSIRLARDASEIPAPQPEVVDPDAYVFNPSLVEKGRRLFSSLGCAACHQKTVDGKPMESTLAAPRLADCGSEGCLSGETKGAASFELLPSQADALAVAIRAGEPTGEPTTDMTLEHTMASLNCFACHSRGGIGGPESDRNALFVSTIPEMGNSTLR